MMDGKRGMKGFSVCYDRFCIGRFSLCFDETGELVADACSGAFEMYLLGMWNDGMVVTMKGYNEEEDENQFVLLFPDGSERLMAYSLENGFKVWHWRNPGEGRFAYLLEFLRGLEYKGYRGYEEYDEDEGMIVGSVVINDKSLMYGGSCMKEVKEDFIRVIEEETGAL